jgi:hypothetical protein
MSTIASQLNKKIKALSAEHPLERTIISYLGGVFCLLLCVYLYFVSASVLNVIAQREAQQQAAALEGAIGALEQQYFALSHDVDAASASKLGLVPIKAAGYVYRPGSVGLSSASRNAI